MDEIEQLARDVTSREISSARIVGAAHDLARLVLAMLPVVKAAERYHEAMTAPPGDLENNASTKEQYEEHDEAVCGVLHAIAQLRKEIGGE